MSRRILSALLALILVAGFAAVTKADVQGSFDIDITLSPMGQQTEAVKFNIDFQSNLVVNITLSGLTFGADLGFGVTGVEFSILSLTTNLGALSVFDEFVFAAPFGCTNFPATNSQCAGGDVSPIGASGGHNVVDNSIGFVKKRIELELNIAGITLTNLAIFEDVDFPDIQGGGATSPHDHDHFVPGSATGVYFVDQVDSVVDNQTPTFGFGDVISITGQTVSGITVSGSTAICASGRNYIKKRNWKYEVNKACTAQFGMNTTPIESGAKTPLLFEEETLDVEGIEVGGVTIDVSTTFKPLGPIDSTITASFSVLDLANVVATLTSDNITNLTLSKITLAITSGNLSIDLVDTKGDLSIDQTTATLSVVLNPNQNPADFVASITTKAGTGVTSLSLSLGISRGALSLDTATTFSGSGTLAWSKTSFDLGVDGGGGITFGASFSYGPTGMGDASITLGVVF